jgi:ketosteroid isomerase-like protein
MEIRDKIEALFNTIDEMDAVRFAEYLTEDGVFKFGNFPPAEGREAIIGAVDNFFKSIKALKHKYLNMWVHPDTVIYRGEVTYTRHDGSQITLPYLNVFGMDGEKIKDYQIYIDINPLYNPPQE